MVTRCTSILAAAALSLFSSAALADRDDDRGSDGLRFAASLSGAQEPMDTGSEGEGTVKAVFEEDLSAVRVKLKVSDTESDVTASHFHCNVAGLNGPIAFGLFSPGPCDFDGRKTRCTLTNADLTDVANQCEGIVGRPVNNIAALAFAMRDGLIYINVHTTAFPAGEIRGQLLPEVDDDD